MPVRSRAAAAAVLLLLGLPGAGGAAPATLRFRTLVGEYTLAFDTAVIAEADLRALARLSPFLHGGESYAVAPPLERCVDADPAYAACGDRTPASAGFDRNARVNLERGARLLATLRGLRAPRELAPVLEYSRRSLAWSLWLEETKLEFYRTGDAGVLRRAYEGLEPAAVCGPLLDELARAPGREAQYRLVTYRWHNCLNDAYRVRLGDYPLDAWEAFLRAHGVREAVLEPLSFR